VEYLNNEYSSLKLEGLGNSVLSLQHKAASVTRVLSEKELFSSFIQKFHR
jgi:hypothetical protein